jgi:hypothetical protein
LAGKRQIVANSATEIQFLEDEEFNEVKGKSGCPKTAEKQTSGKGQIHIRFAPCDFNYLWNWEEGTIIFCRLLNF